MDEDVLKWSRENDLQINMGHMDGFDKKLKIKERLN